MKYTLSVILISAAVSTIFWGGFMMHDSNGHAHCPFSAMNNGGCMDAMDSLAGVLAHLSAIIGISNGVVVWPAILLIAFAFAALFAVFVFAAAKFPANIFLTRRVLEHKQNSIFSPGKLLGWLSILEKRDPSIFAAVKI